MPAHISISNVLDKVRLFTSQLVSSHFPTAVIIFHAMGPYRDSARTDTCGPAPDVRIPVHEWLQRRGWGISVSTDMALDDDHFFEPSSLLSLLLLLFGPSSLDLR